jgi:uncharacterized protein YecE (DUF72 family)
VARTLLPGGAPAGRLARTAPWTYLRFHEGAAWPPPCYERDDLARWAERLAGGWGPDADIFVFFNNDPGACAVLNAAEFAEAARAAGLRPTRTPPPDSIRRGAG